MGLLDDLPDDWREKISERVDPKDIQKIERNLASAGNICPERDDIFKAFHLCTFESVKVVIVGQDPYTHGEATGLAFAVKSDQGITTSLGRIYDLLTAANKTPPLNSELEEWARRRSEKDGGDS
jgi:uracil-DNA glycosylase